MVRAAAREYIFSTLTGDAAIMAALGTVASTNRRVYSGWPQEQPVLSSSGEPTEGWLVFLVDDPTKIDLSSIYETLRITFHLFTTLASVSDTIIDRLDALWQLWLWQQRDITFADRTLLKSRRVQTQEKYDDDAKLYVREIAFDFLLVKTVLDG